MDEKTNFLSPDSSASNALNNEPPQDDLGKTIVGKINSGSSPSSDIKLPENTFSDRPASSELQRGNQTGSPLTSLPLNSPGSTSSAKFESAFNEKGQDLPTGLPGKKKPNVFLWILGIIISLLISAVGSGYAVYFMLNRNTQPLLKEKALLQSQVGSLKSQIDLLSKENTNLVSAVTRLQEQLEAKNAAGPAEATAPENPAGDSTQSQPAPTAPVIPENPAIPGATPGL